jgi:hypothetical protein
MGRPVDWAEAALVNTIVVSDNRMAFFVIIGCCAYAGGLLKLRDLIWFKNNPAFSWLCSTLFWVALD